MGRTKGSANLAASLEVLAGAPLDARLVVDTFTDLTTAATFPYSYVGMPVYVKDEKKIYVLNEAGTTTASNWGAASGDGKTEVAWGYLYNNKFYVEQAHTTEITAAVDTIYVERETKKLYEYDGTDYVVLSDGVDATVYQPGGSYAFASLPAPAAGTLGFVYDVTDAFTTTSDFREGAGIDYPAGTNVSVVNVGSAGSPVYKYDILMGNLTGYQKKIQYTALPTASADYLGAVFQYLGTSGGGLIHGYFYECVLDGSSYVWEERKTQAAGDLGDLADVDTTGVSDGQYLKYDLTSGKWIPATGAGGQTIQYSTLPAASADNVGQIAEYTGATGGGLIHGFFYECVAEGEDPVTYSWVQVETSKGGHDVKDNGTAVTKRDTLNFTDFDISDDSTNAETDIKAHRLTAAELAEAVSPLPCVPLDMPVLFDETGAERQVGWYILANGKKKPVYQKSIISSSYWNLSANSWTSTGESLSNIDTLINVIGNRDGRVLPIGAMVSSNVVDIISYRSTGDEIDKIIVSYTKTTDTPID